MCFATAGVMEWCLIWLHPFHLSLNSQAFTGVSYGEDSELFPADFCLCFLGSGCSHGRFLLGSPFFCTGQVTVCSGNFATAKNGSRSFSPSPDKWQKMLSLWQTAPMSWKRAEWRELSIKGSFQQSEVEGLPPAQIPVFWYPHGLVAAAPCLSTSSMCSVRIFMFIILSVNIQSFPWLGGTYNITRGFHARCRCGAGVNQCLTTNTALRAGNVLEFNCGTWELLKMVWKKKIKSHGYLPCCRIRIFLEGRKSKFLTWKKGWGSAFQG